MKLFLSGVVLSVLLCFSLFPSAGASSTWSRTYGGTGDDKATSLVATSDGGYALAGRTYSFGAGGSDFWLIKTDTDGNMQWNQTYGGITYDYAYSVIQTSDGGYAIAGRTESFGAGNDDFWLVKTDSAGNMQWNQTYGVGRANSLVATADGGYAMAGANSFGAGYDFSLVTTDALGNMQWNKTYDGGTDSGEASSVVQTIDGGYAILGIIESVTGDLPFNITIEQDSWLAKTDALGNMQWNKTWSGYTCSLVATSDGGYALAGSAISLFSGDENFWFVKTNENDVVPEYSSWVAPSLVLAAAVPILFYRKKLLHGSS